MPAGSPGMEVVRLSGMTSFSSVQMADNPLCTLLARKISAEALGLQLTLCVCDGFEGAWRTCELINLSKVPILCDDRS
jgi:hypothetical protein